MGTSAHDAAARPRPVKGRVEINIQRCKGCELCIHSCKENVLSVSPSINNKGYHFIVANNELCTGCTNCALVCPDAVISVFRTRPQKKTAISPASNLLEPLNTGI